MAEHKHDQLIGGAYLAGARSGVRWAIQRLKAAAAASDDDVFRDAFLCGAEELEKSDSPFDDDGDEK